MNQCSSKILMLTTEYPPHVWGGIGTHVFHLTNELAHHGITGTVLTLPYKEGDCQGSPGFTIARPLSPDPAYFSSTYEWIINVNLAWIRYLTALQGGFQAVHAHDWLTAGAALYVQNSIGLPLIATIHSLETGRKRKLKTHSEKLIHSMEKKLIEKADSLIVCSDYMKQELLTLGAEARKITVIPNGVSPFLSRAVAPALQAPYLMAMGRFVPEKGFQDLLKAFARMKHKLPGYKLVLAGEGPCKPLYQKLAEDLKIQDDVIFPGFMKGEALNRYIHHAAITCVPSTYEPFGIAALEFMAAGKPMVVSDAGGLPEAAEDGKTGLIYKRGEVEQLASAILTLAYDQKKAAALGTGARAASEAFSWMGVAQKTSDLYKRLLHSW
ncbi:glycosyltransferase [Bacillus mangrovi]|uniref:Glycosyltransferase n=1 Tax=Metabacillus mangrovi TaxID=1491830 RepID=A0A7X2S391_9BACI|nr:glycosyltransferase family 4 protein [Metabacillus mangrovi]MTH52421.1 glycosyltransferase [Metabacillus mangrovi]